MHSASWSARQIPQEKSVDISEKQLASRRLLPGAGNIFKQPAQLQAAEVRAQWQSGLQPEAVLPALAGEARDIIRNPHVLPNNRIRVADDVARFASATRMSCQTIAFATGLPVLRSH